MLTPTPDVRTMVTPQLGWRLRQFCSEADYERQSSRPSTRGRRSPNPAPRGRRFPWFPLVRRNSRQSPKLIYSRSKSQRRTMQRMKKTIHMELFQIWTDAKAKPHQIFPQSALVACLKVDININFYVYFIDNNHFNLVDIDGKKF